MPRTKAVKKKTSPELCGYSHAVIPIILEQKKQIHIGLEQKSTEFLHKLRAQLTKLKLSIPKNIADKTIGELDTLQLTVAEVCQVIEYRDRVANCRRLHGPQGLYPAVRRQSLISTKHRDRRFLRPFTARLHQRSNRTCPR
jgi:hypothetical protein